MARGIHGPSVRARAGRRSRALWALALAAAAVGLAPRGRAEDAPPTACGAWAFLDEPDEALRVAYDGLRRGLEEASLARVCLRRPAGADEAAFALAAREAADSAPAFLAALGPVAGRRLSRALSAVPDRPPLVFVDVVGTVGGRASTPPPDAPPRSAVVRAEVAAEAWGDLVRRLLPGQPKADVLLPWTAETPDAAAWRAAFARASGLEVRTLASGGGPAAAILHLGPGLGETIEPFEAAAARARALGRALLSGERGRFGQGAAVVLVPDAALLGRTAAEAVRRLLAGEGADAPLRLAVRGAETWVDLEAADAEGFSPPLPFLAGASRLRRTRAPAAEGGQR